MRPLLPNKGHCRHCHPIKNTNVVFLITADTFIAYLTSLPKLILAGHRPTPLNILGIQFKQLSGDTKPRMSHEKHDGN